MLAGTSTRQSSEKVAQEEGERFGHWLTVLGSTCRPAESKQSLFWFSALHTRQKINCRHLLCISQRSNSMHTFLCDKPRKRHCTKMKLFVKFKKLHFSCNLLTVPKHFVSSCSKHTSAWSKANPAIRGHQSLCFCTATCWMILISGIV